MSAKVVFANRYFHPDVSATSQMLSDLAQRLAHCGVEVHVVCSRQLYENPSARLMAEEWVDRVRVHRVWTASFGRDRLLGRAMDYLSFYITAGVRLLTLARRGDLIVAKTDPPLLSVVGALVARARGAILVNWLQDLFPEVATRLYVGSIPRPVERFLGFVRDRSLRAAHANIALGARMQEYLLLRGIARDRVKIIENWADGGALRPKPAAQSELRCQLDLQDRFVVAYSGNLGRAHEFDTILQAAERLRADPAFVFLMIGGGARMSALRQQVAERGLTSFRFVPYQPREALVDSLAAADVHLACLLPELEGLIVPSKIYGILAAGRPTVFVGDLDGEVPRLLGEAACGMSVSCGDGEGLAEQLRILRSDPQLRAKLGACARHVFEERYTLERAAAKWLQLLTEVGLVSPARTAAVLRSARP